MTALPEDETYLDITGAHGELQSMGFTGVTRRQVENWAEFRRLPFFKFQKRLYIERGALRRAFRTLQQEAIRQ